MKELTISENLADLYYEKLSDSGNPGVTLAQFYGSVFGLDVSKKEVIMFNRLLKIYGRFLVYFSILDMTTVRDLNTENPFGLLSFFARKRLDQKYGIIMIESQNLDRTATTLESKIEKQRKMKLNIPELLDG